MKLRYSILAACLLAMTSNAVTNTPISALPVSALVANQDAFAVYYWTGSNYLVRRISGDSVFGQITNTANAVVTTRAVLTNQQVLPAVFRASVAATNLIGRQDGITNAAGQTIPQQITTTATNAATAVVDNALSKNTLQDKYLWPPKTFQYINGVSLGTLRSNKFFFNDGTYAHHPGPSYANEVYLQDWLMALDGLGHEFDLVETWNLLTTWSNAFFTQGSFPNSVKATKLSDFGEGDMPGVSKPSNLDVPFEYMHLIWLDCLHRNSIAAFTNFFPSVCSNAMQMLRFNPSHNPTIYPMDFVEIQNGLVTKDTGRSGFSFHDSIPTYGYDLWLNLFRFRALNEVAELSGAAGNLNMSSNYSWQARHAATNLLIQNWTNASGGWFVACTSPSHGNVQPDALGSAFAVYIGAVSGTNRSIIASNCAATSPGGPLFATKPCITNGCPIIPGLGVYWTDGGSVATGTYQNGGGWPGFAGVWNYAVNQYSSEQAEQNWLDLADAYRSWGNHAPLECINFVGGGHVGLPGMTYAGWNMEFFNRTGPHYQR